MSLMEMQTCCLCASPNIQMHVLCVKSMPEVQMHALQAGSDGAIESRLI